ncbi:hypothetical protein SeLEV6574_g03657 [Synchytrium endobioticum]|uniref:Uncharacterized protein n=1 Tax=Synchytrium endobioticum TaxID=286115 RepID=A0A507D3H8_9FUNG|nr:hypothetical protein SeLEV6574_g03657 [Synchytrium endobioticum]
MVLSFLVEFFFDFLLQQRIDIEVVTRMAKFITISLLAYAAAFLFFTPVREARQRDDDICIHRTIFAVTNPTHGTVPLSCISDRIKIIVSKISNILRTKCIIEEVLELPANLLPERYASLRGFHESVFNKLKFLFESLTEAINNNNNDIVRQVLREAQGLVFTGILWHRKQEGIFKEFIGSRGRWPQKKLKLPLYQWKTFWRYVDEEAYLELLRSLRDSETSGALPAPLSSPHALPVYSGTHHDGPDSEYDATAADTYVSATQGALPDPSSLDSWCGQITNQYDDGPDSRYAPPYGNAAMFDSTNPGIQLSDGYNDPQYYPYDTELALPAHEQVGPSSSGTLNNPYDYGYDEPNFGYVPSHQAPPSPALTHIYKDSAFIQYEIELGLRAHEQAGPSGGSTSYSDSRNKQHNERRNIDD